MGKEFKGERIENKDWIFFGRMRKGGWTEVGRGCVGKTWTNYNGES